MTISHQKSLKQLTVNIIRIDLKARMRKENAFCSLYNNAAKMLRQSDRVQNSVVYCIKVRCRAVQNRQGRL